jgi:hypothetical protein
MRWRRSMRCTRGVALAIPAAALLTAVVPAVTSTAHASGYPSNVNPLKWGMCSGYDAHSANCVDVSNAYPPSGWGGAYVGHDEPSVLFYSHRPGSGNNNTYVIRLPKDPAVPPDQNGTGGTPNAFLHPAFWFGMAMCDTQSFPNFTTKCPADSDSNIFTSTNPSSPRYIGKHPGTAFMEMQFYPPGWIPWPAGNSCAATQWCAALNIDSYSSNPAGVNNNSACLNTVGVEYVNFAFITKNGVAQAPANPLNATAATYTPNPRKDLFMHSGDVLAVHMRDTRAGFQVYINDLTARTHGFMTASVANDFGQIKYQPTAKKCSVTRYAFHPMYSTSSPSTRVPWAAHSYNVAFADEIGHMEYCASVDTSTGTCNTPDSGDSGNPVADDVACFPASDSTRFPVSGCFGTDNDFDGPPYRDDWPGTAPAARTAQPIAFLSPTFNGFQRYSKIAFEADLPRIEYSDLGGPPPYCDPATGALCVNPPRGAKFYPFYTTGQLWHHVCYWQLGGAGIPGTTREFGGSSTTEYGTRPLALPYPVVNSSGQPTVQFKYEDFRNILPYNPC